jgi:large subunit ribosomal protein L29
MKKAKEFRDLSIEELTANYEDACQQLFQLRNEREHSKKMEKPQRLPLLKKEIARMLTVLREKQPAKESV